MALNLLNVLKDKIGGNLAEHSQTFLGEDSDKTSAAIGGTYATLLAGLIEKGSTERGANQIFKTVQKANPEILNNVEQIFTRSPQTINGLVNTGTRDLPTVLGNKQREASNLIAGESGMKKEASSKLMKLATPFLMSMLGKEVASNNLDAKGLMNVINSQKSNLSSALPEGMKNVLQLSSFGWTKDAVKVEPIKKVKKKKVAKKEKIINNEIKKEKVIKPKKVKKPAPKVVKKEVTEAASGGLGWLRWLLIPLVLGLLGWFGYKGCADGAASKVAATTTNVVKDVSTGATDAAKAAGNAVGNAAKAVTNVFGNVNDAALKALDGIKFAAGSAGGQMMNFIKGGAKGEGKFRFKNLNFASGSSTIAGTSGAEVDNLAAILKAYTDVKVSVQGYTDSKGNATSNQTLSQQRADAVKARLISKGIAANRISTKGFGAANPVATNDTAEGRAENRRIEVVIVK